MAYIPADLTYAVPLTKDLRVWKYTTTGTQSSVLSADYFEETPKRLFPGDLVIVYASDGASLYTVRTDPRGLTLLLVL